MDRGLAGVHLRRMKVEGRASPERLGWKAEEFGLNAEGNGEPLKVLEPLRDLARSFQSSLLSSV